MELLNINGLTYEVTKVLGRNNVSAFQRKVMRQQRKARFLFLRLPKGRATYHVAEYRGAKGERLYGSIMSMGVM